MKAAFLFLLLVPAWAAAGISAYSWKTGNPALVLDWKSEDAVFPGEVGGTVALPPGCEGVSARVEVLEQSPYPGLAGAEAPPVFGKPARFRDLNLAAFRWTPMRRQGDQTFRITRARLHLAFRMAPASGARAFAGGAGDPAERLLARWLVNYDQSRQFRVAPPPLARVATPAALPPIRLSVYTQRDGIAALTYERLAAAKVPVSKLDPRRLQMFRNGREIPLYVHGEEDGRFEPGEYVEFIGSRAAGRNTHLSPYAREAAFTLVWGQAMGLRAPAVPVAPKSGDNPAGPHAVSAHLEMDEEILRVGSTAVEDITDLGANVAEEELSDFWFWTRHGFERDAKDIPFDLPYAPAAGTLVPSPQRPVLRVQLKGITNDVKADPDHHLSFLLNGVDISRENGAPRHALWEGQNSYTWVSPPLPDNALKAGPNVLTLVRVNDLRNSDGNLVENQDAYLNFIEIDFLASHRAVDNALRFASAGTGRRRYRLEEFGSPDLSLWDARGRKLTGFSATRESRGHRFDFEDSLMAPAEYWAAAASAREVPALRLDTLPDLQTPSAGADWLVITHRALFGSGLDSLAAARRAQGLRVKVVDILHVYQAFGDGSTDPEAIRRFVQWAYQNWPRPAPTYLLLVGETSTWFDKKGGGSLQNLVPTSLVNIRGWGVAAADDRFAQVSGEDPLADMLVGRIPVANKTDLSNVVRKILTLESRPAGAWRNKSYFIGGFEQGFTTGQNRLQALAANANRPPTRLDLFPPSPYFRPPSGRADFYRQLDSGFAFVGFFGHGGGSVWSDAGILTLDALDKDSLRGDYPISLVSSITCLTGYFEDAAARSLGEELLRRPRNGSAGFYGASGYISNAAGDLLASELFRAATGAAPLTLGAVAHQAETQVLLKSGSNFLPILAEFNLLGDPAMPYGLPPRSGSLTVSPFALGGGRQLQASGSAATASGEVLISLLLGDSVAANALAPVSGGRWNHTFNLPAALPPVQGRVIAHAWNAARSDLYSADFSALDWLVDSLRVEPSNPQPGDSVRVRFRLRHNLGTAGTGVVLYSVSGDAPGLFPPENQVPIAADGANAFVTARQFALPLPAPDAPSVLQLNLALRMDARDSSGNPLPPLSSRVFSFPLKPLARMALMKPGFHLPIQETLGVWVRYRNDGLGQNGAGRVMLGTNPPGAWKDSAAWPRALSMGQTDSVFIRLPDSALRLPLRAMIIPDNSAESHVRENTRDTNFGLWTTRLGTSDSSAPWAGGPVIRLASGSRRRVFTAAIPSVSPGGFLSPIDTSALARTAYFVTTPEPSARSLRLAPPPSLRGSGTDAWHFSQKSAGPWLRLDSASSQDDALILGPGYYGFFRNSDRQPPLIRVQSRGQSLLADDYVPRNTPIQALIEDPSGIDLSLRKPTVRVGSGDLDAGDVTLEVSDGFPTLARLQFQPPQNPRDSLIIEAHDAAGNRAQKTLAYRVGERFAIRNLGGYPNPFADTTVFAYSLTDYCDEVVLRVYSRSGRMVRTLRDRKAVGYREVVWDGRTDDGKAIANGLYFLKATAKGGGREASATFKLFKKKR